MMTCEAFDFHALDLDRADADPAEAAAAAQHAEVCGRCSAMLESWREVKSDLRLLREETRTGSAPPRLEMRLKQEFRTRRETRVPRSTVAVATWALAAAAVLAAGVGWMRSHHAPAGIGNTEAVAKPSAGISQSIPTTAERGDLLAEDYDTGEFTQLPGSLPSQFGDEAILQVRLQRGALGRFGLPVAPEHSSEWVSVDFLVGEDGQPQAVRLHQDWQIAGMTQ